MLPVISVVICPLSGQTTISHTFFNFSKVVLYLTGWQLISLFYKFPSTSGEKRAHLTSSFIFHHATEQPNKERENH